MLARGRDRAYIEEALVVSRNTVKAHVKHVYAKLGIHSHQELIDLVEGPSTSSTHAADSAGSAGSVGSAGPAGPAGSAPPCAPRTLCAFRASPLPKLLPGKCDK